MSKQRPCPFPGGHLWSMARLRDGRQQCLFCSAIRYLRIVKGPDLRTVKEPTR